MNMDKGITVDTLFVGPTRPTTFWGVTWQAFLMNVIVTMEAFVWTRNLIWLLLFIPLHGICYLICMREARTFELLLHWGPTKGLAYLQNFSYWKAATFSPLTLRSGRRPSLRSKRRFRKMVNK